MKLTVAACLILAFATPALADMPKEPVKQEQPQPDLDKPITTTLRKVQAIVAASVAQAAAQSAAQAAKVDFEDMMKQATPTKP